MQKRFDFSKKYAVALGGGGAKGGYEVGVWKAFSEEGFKYSAVSGTSVGALNGALMCMHTLDAGVDLWRNIRYSQVMDVNDDTMSRVFRRDIPTKEIRPLLRKVIGIVNSGGFDVTPLRNLMREYVDPEKIKRSDVDFYIVTYSISDKREVDVNVKELPENEMCDMLLASAYFPAFKNEPLMGKRFADGGFSDSLPITPLIEHGAKDIIAIRISDFGREKKVRPPEGVNIEYIEPKRRLGNTLNFSSQQSRFNMDLGYYDAKRFIYGLDGSYYYIDRTLSEKQAYEILIRFINDYAKRTDPDISLRAIHEVVIPKLAREHGASGDYYDILIHYLEHTGEAFGIPEFRIIKDVELADEVMKAVSQRGFFQPNERRKA